MFDMDGKIVTFTSEFPNDLKMMAFLAGELPIFFYLCQCQHRQL